MDENKTVFDLTVSFQVSIVLFDMYSQMLNCDVGYCKIHVYTGVDFTESSSPDTEVGLAYYMT